MAERTCNCCGDEAETLELVVEAGWKELCRKCAAAFWTMFYRAETASEGLER